jgi:ribose transport system ATP-binding protein
MSVRVKINSINKSFGSVSALKNISIEIRDNEVVGLVGENGAGKSTLLKVISGNFKVDSGDFSISGQNQVFESVNDAMNLGISMVYQEQSLLPNISVAENIFLGIEDDAVKLGVYSLTKLRKKAKDYLRRVSLNIDPKIRTEDLSFGVRQMVEIAKALAKGEFSGRSPVLLLDEPTSVLEKKEIDTLFEVIREIKEHFSVVFVSHRLEEVLQISDRVYVMRDGEIVAEINPKTFSTDKLFSLMVGRELFESYFHEELTNTPNDEIRLQVKDLSGKGFDKVNLAIKSGEILSILGLQESGRENLARVIFCVLPRKHGEVFINGIKFKHKNTKNAVSAGIGYIPSERKTDGMIELMDVGDNLTLAHPDIIQKNLFISKRKIAHVFHEWGQKLSLKAPSSATPMKSLSGGNQQKVILAKWLLDPDLKILILDTPTRGLDVGAKTEIYKILRQLASRGISILLLADSLEEGLFMSHRVITMKDGHISAEFESSPGNRPERTIVVEKML